MAATRPASPRSEVRSSRGRRVATLRRLPAQTHAGGWLRRACVAAAALATVGCRAADTSTLDLVARFAFAQVGTEPGLVDLGLPEARRYLVDGWGRDEPGFVWGLGEQSVFEFYLRGPRDLPVTFRCAPFQFPGAPAQEVAFDLNGRGGPRVTLRGGMAEYRVVLSGSASRAGWNRLALRYAYARAPADVIRSADDRPLAVAWDFLRFGDEAAAPVPAPRVDDASNALVIPPGTSVRYFLRVRPGSRLILDEVSAAQPAGAALTVRVEADGGRHDVLARLDPAQHRPREISIPGQWAGVVGLSLEAEDSTVRIGRATLRAPAETSADPRSPLRTRRPNILIYLIDTLRADRLGCYGLDRSTSPQIDALARDGVLFTDALAESSWTRTSVATLFTGLAPTRHGIYGRIDALRGGAVTMAGLLRAVGYETAAFLTNGNVASVFGLGQGFDVYELLPGAVVPGPDGVVLEPLPGSHDLTRRALRWLRARRAERPFFLYLHAADPHGPYQPPSAFRRRLRIPEGATDLGSLDGLRRLKRRELPADEPTRATLLSLYDAEVAENDHYFGLLLAELRRRGLYDEMLVVLLGDHGEEFHEHGGWEHGRTLYREVVRVPLLIKLPNGLYAGHRVDGSVQLADVLPTLLGYLGLKPPTSLEGVDLLNNLLDAPAARPGRAAFSHLALDGYVEDAVTEGHWKLADGWTGLQLFDRDADPGEQVSVLGEHPVMAAYLRARLAERLSRGEASLRARAPVPRDDVKRNLRALGYVD